MQVIWRSAGRASRSGVLFVEILALWVTYLKIRVKSVRAGGADLLWVDAGAHDFGPDD